jgi:hypothetical protein
MLKSKNESNNYDKIERNIDLFVKSFQCTIW